MDPLDLAQRLLDAARAAGAEAADALVGRPLADFVPAEWHGRLESLVATAHLSGWRGEFPLLTPSGDTVPVEWNLSSLVEPGLLLGVATDLSERMALSRQREALLELVWGSDTERSIFGASRRR